MKKTLTFLLSLSVIAAGSALYAGSSCSGSGDKASYAKADGKSCGSKAMHAKAEGGHDYKAMHAKAEGKKSCGAKASYAKAEGKSCSAKKSNLVQTALEAGQFQTLASALKAAGLTDVLAEGGPYTVFAPSDAAFAKLPAETLESLMQPENHHRLKAILKYHVVSGKITSDQVSPGHVETIQGEKLNVNASDSGVQVNNASVVQADIHATNGVIHAIDNVLLPSAGSEDGNESLSSL